MIYVPKHRNNELNKSKKTIVSLQIDTYITSSAHRGNPDISPRKPTALLPNIKSQLPESVSHRCFSTAQHIHLLFKSYSPNK